MRQGINASMFKWVTNLMIILPLIYFIGDYGLEKYYQKKCTNDATIFNASSDQQCDSMRENSKAYYEKNWQKTIIIEMTIMLGLFLKLFARRKKWIH